MDEDDTPDLGRRTFLKCAGVGLASAFLNACGIFPAQNPVPETCAGKECGELDVGYGTKIYYEFTPARVGRKTLVFCQGFNGSAKDPAIIEEGEEFGKLVFSHAGHLYSGSFPPEIGNTIPNAASSLEKLLDYARERDFITGENEVFIGFSMGAKILENYLAKHPEETRGFVLVNGQDIPCGKNTIDLLDALIGLQFLLNPFNDLRAKYEYVKSLGEVDSSSGFEYCGNPTLIIASELDELVPVEDMRAMAARKPNSRYYELAGERHGPSVDGIKKMNEIFYENVGFLMSR